MSRRSVNHWQKRLIPQHIRSANQTLAKLSRNARQNSNQGFALPMALGMGLIMLLVGVTMILRSQDDQVTASAQKATGRGLSAAETGITRIQSFINQNRALAAYNYSDWKDWSNVTATNQYLTANQHYCANSVSNPSTIQAKANDFGGWTDVDSNDSAKGQFKLIDYTYTPTDHSKPGNGTLVVQGRVNQVGSGNTATTNVSTSSSQVAVNVPVNEGNINDVPVPGAWISNGNTGNNTIQGNVLINDPSVAIGNISVSGTDPDTGKPYKACYSTLEIPPLPSKPNPMPNSLGDITTTLTLPRVTDTGTTKNIDGKTVTVYEYSANRINLPNSSTLTVTPGQRVDLYLNGNIEKGGNIAHSCPPNMANCEPTDFQIFGYGPTGSHICMNGNGYIEAFILAPNYLVGAAGTGSEGGIKGSVWAKSWSTGGGCGSNTSKVVVEQTAKWDFLSFNREALIRKLPPKITSISSWQRQEVAP